MTEREMYEFAQTHEWAKIGPDRRVNFTASGEEIFMDSPRDPQAEPFNGSYRLWPRVGGHRVHKDLLTPEERALVRAWEGGGKYAPDSGLIRTGQNRTAAPVAKATKMFSTLIAQVEAMREPLKLSDEQVELALLHVWSNDADVKASSELLESLGYKCQMTNEQRELFKSCKMEVPTQWDFDLFKKWWK